MQQFHCHLPTDLYLCSTSSQPLLTSSLLYVSTSILTELYLNSASHYSTLLYFTLFYSPLSSTLLYFTLLYSEYFWIAMAPRQIRGMWVKPWACDGDTQNWRLLASSNKLWFCFTVFSNVPLSFFSKHIYYTIATVALVIIDHHWSTSEHAQPLSKQESKYSTCCWAFAASTSSSLASSLLPWPTQDRSRQLQHIKIA